MKIQQFGFRLVITPNSSTILARGQKGLKMSINVNVLSSALQYFTIGLFPQLLI